MNDLYERALAVVAGVAKNHGYAIGLHGSGVRDLDLIACPWTDAAVDGHDLARMIANALYFEFDGSRGFLVDTADLLKDAKWPEPNAKPHGRWAYTIWLSPNLPLDLSVMPRLSDQRAV